MKFSLSILATLCAGAAIAEENTSLDAHEHGVGELNIAIDGKMLAMELHAPGADIVGFEYRAESDEDHAKIDAAIETLEAPLSLFSFPEKAGCVVNDAHASLEGEHGKDAHGHEGHDHDDHDDHADHEENHTEFHAEYAFTCESPAELTSIVFGYFETFENALELEVQVVSAAGAHAAEVERDAPMLELNGMF